MKQLKDYIYDIDKLQPSYKFSNEYLYEEMKDFFINVPSNYSTSELWYIK